MALVRRDVNHVAEWPMFALPERWRRFFDVDDMEGWMRVEEFHDGDTLVVRAELPGINPDKDVEVTTSGGFVKIRAHREEKTKHTETAGYRSEFRYGEFERDIALPDGIVSADVTATYKDGILEVRVPHPEGAVASAQSIPITRA
ncbi:MAG: Hsp20/alpha crystallin family protein [Actinomycetota bacterium]|jgi:HSP20 family protein|nr:Hsp20/alpha crystallin family protein [Actinomycetota bacterium]